MSPEGRQPGNSGAKDGFAQGRRAILLSLLVVFTAVFCGVKAQPAEAKPRVTSEAYCLVDMASGQVLLGHNQHQRRSPASTTKMVTALVVRSYCSLDEQVTISPKAAATPPSSIGIRSGQKWTLDDLLKACLVKSANDASVALAEHVAGSQALFGNLMTRKALLLGASQSNFVNASGLSSPNHLSTAYDLAIIGRAVLSDPYLASIVGSPRITINHPGYSQPFPINNTNRLLSAYPGCTGIKTGTTNRAGQCLVSSADQANQRLIAVALRSGDRYGDCRRMLDYGFEKNEYYRIFGKTDIIKWINTNGGRGKRIGVRPARRVGLLMAADEQPSVQKVIKMDYSPVKRPREGDRLGTLRIYYQGELVDSVPLVAASGNARKPWWMPWKR